MPEAPAPARGVMFVRCGTCGVSLPSVPVDHGDPAEGMVSHGLCGPCDREAWCEHVFGPLSYACTLDGHSAERQCSVCGIHEYWEQRPCIPTECERCSEALDAGPSGDRARRQEFAERQRPLGGW